MAKKKEPQPELPGVDWKALELAKELDANQVEMSAWLKSVSGRYRLVVVNASRQLGKSFWLLVEAVRFGLENPGAQIKYGAKSQKQVRKIIKPHLRAIFSKIPKAMRPVWNAEDGEYVFHNDASLTVAGCDKDYAEALAGQHAHIFIIDEGGAVKDLAFIVKDIALPQTLNTGGRLIIASTPARMGGHAFKGFCEEAKQHGTYIERDIFCNPRITDETIREYCELSGGPTSSSWRREYLVQHVTDESSAGLPEATPARLRAITVTDAQLKASRSPWVDRYVAVMPMWNPNFTGIVWAHYDYRRTRLVVEDSLIIRKLDSLLVRQALDDRREQLWGDEADVYKCILGSREESLIFELSDLGWSFVPSAIEDLGTMPGGDTARVALNKLRHSITHRRGVPIFIHERCEDLKRQLENATWDKTRKKFERNELDGFYPLVTALAAVRNDLNEKHDATPDNAALRRGVTHPHFDERQSAKRTGVKRMFGLRR